jgi:hypothetical protein
MKRRKGAVPAACIVVWVAAAVSCSSSPPTGGVRQACYGNGSCNAGLVCLSKICVQPDTGTGGNGGGAAGSGGGGGAAGSGNGGGAAGSGGGGGAAGSGGGGGAAGSGGGGGAAGTGGHAGAAGSSGLATLALPVGPLMVASGTESTECATLALGNAGHSMIRRIRATFGAGLVHAILYKTTATTASALAPCTDLGGAASVSSSLHPVFETNQAALEIDFPTLPALTGPDLADHQMVTVEIHGSDRGDTTGTPLSLSGEIDVDVIPFPAGGVASDLMLTGTTTISIPANATSYGTSVLFQPVDSAIDIFALSTMQHHLGVEFRIWQGTSAAASSQTAIVDDTNAVAPGMHSFSTPLAFTAAGSGLAFQCSWVNNTQATVSFGTGSSDETCFIWQYYAPAGGYHLCLNGTCQF